MDIFIGVGTGIGVSFLLSFLLKKQKIYQTKQEANHIVQVVKDSEESDRERIFNRMEEYKMNLMEEQEVQKEQLLRDCRFLKNEIKRLARQKENDISNQEIQKNKKQEELKSILDDLNKKRSSFQKFNNQLKNKQKDYVQQLRGRFKVDLRKIKTEFHKKEMLIAKEQILGHLQKDEENFKHSLNKQAHFILELALSRFRRPYCAERGIKNVVFPRKSVIQHLLGSDFSKMKILEKECGVDMKVSDTEPSVSIFGIDPVRRELGRVSLQKISKRRHLQARDIKHIVRSCKKELFKKIVADGQRICRDLKLKGLKKEVKDMMGALRYRYSFAQNQHFHCEEVGWLCGLLDAELKEHSESVLQARRAGMLHDIGKVMDYSKDGGHAVIGADFIKKHGETADIVHAVRAHHYDVSPENPLDFLVIAADALSGARPGARRSTEDSYNQKVLTLEKIGRSFKGVKDTYIMNAGREIRVIVDSAKIDDIQALSLSKKIAAKIEEECSYPGLITVTVVRTVTQSVEMPRQSA